MYNSLTKNLYVIVISNTSLPIRMHDEHDERLPPLEIFCPYCQPNLWYYLLFPQTAERKMKQSVFSIADGYISVAYSCEGCLELYVRCRDGVCSITPMQSGNNGIRLPQEYQEYLRKVFGEFELANESH